MVDFDALLQGKPEEAKKPEPLPNGTYSLKLGKFETGESGKKKTPYVRLPMTPVACEADVDQDMLPDNWQRKTVREDFWFTADALFRTPGLPGEHLWSEHHRSELQGVSRGDRGSGGQGLAGPGPLAEARRRPDLRQHHRLAAGRVGDREGDRSPSHFLAHMTILRIEPRGSPFEFAGGLFTRRALRMLVLPPRMAGPRMTTPVNGCGSNIVRNLSGVEPPPLCGGFGF